MENKRARLFGILLLLASFATASLFSFWITNPSVLDTDPSTYIVVVMLMLLLFIVFSYKEKLEFKYSKRNLPLALLVFLIYAVILSVLRVSLSYSFISYRLDGLMMPILLASFIILIYGFNGIRKLWIVLVYAAFASPLILIPVLNLNNAFANLNASIVYWFIRLFGISASKTGLTIFSTSGSSITISTTCVSIGTFVAFVLFLIPLAYLYDGKLAKKFYWVISGILLIVALNLLRMLTIALIWINYGITSAVNIFHLFAGQLIFYAAIIIMILIAGKYGLELGRKMRRQAKEKTKHRLNRDWRIATLACILIVLCILFLSYSYLDAAYAPALLFSGNGVNRTVADQYIFISLSGSVSNVVSLGTSPNGDLFSIKNLSDLNNSIFIIANATGKALPGRVDVVYEPKGPPLSHLLRNGITITTQVVESENNTLIINYFSVPHNLNGNWVSINYFLFKEYNGTFSSCKATGASSIADSFQSDIYNLIYSRNLSDNDVLCESYSIALGESK
jgi:exosortase/archaeosortase family protein